MLSNGVFAISLPGACAFKLKVQTISVGVLKNYHTIIIKELIVLCYRYTTYSICRVGETFSVLAMPIFFQTN